MESLTFTASDLLFVPRSGAEGTHVPPGPTSSLGPHTSIRSPGPFGPENRCWSLNVLLYSQPFHKAGGYGCGPLASWSPWRAKSACEPSKAKSKDARSTRHKDQREVPARGLPTAHSASSTMHVLYTFMSYFGFRKTPEKKSHLISYVDSAI